MKTGRSTRIETDRKENIKMLQTLLTDLDAGCKTTIVVDFSSS